MKTFGRIMIATVLAATALTGPPPAVNAQAPADWKVGLAQAKITPDNPIFMSGYASRNRPFDSVAGDLYVKAMVLEDGSGHRAAIVTTDLLGIPASVADPICRG